MLAVGGSAGKASWLTDGEPESQHRRKKNSVYLMLRVEDADVHFLISINIETLPALS